MRIEHNGDTYVAYCKLSEKHLFLGAGWNFNPKIKKWVTDSDVKAMAFYDHAIEHAKTRLAGFLHHRQQKVAPSRASDTSKVFKAPEGLSYLPYQNAGIEYIMARKDTLLADAPGLGKTIQGIGTMNEMRAFRTLIICPASLKKNWKKEIDKWNTLGENFDVGIAGPKWVTTPSVIVNFEMLKKFSRELREEDWDLIIVDESQNIVNLKAERSKQVYGWGKKIKPLRARKRLWMTGTPILNKPVDLWAVCRAFDRWGLGKNWEQFVYRYCDASETHFGVDTTGSSNLKELQYALRTTFMIRRTKEQVLKELPAKRRQVFELPKKGLTKVLREEMTFFEANMAMLEDLNDNFKEEERITPLEAMEYIQEKEGSSMSDKIDQLAEAEKMMFESSGAIRRDLALAKAPMCIEYIKQLHESGVEKIIMFCHHKEVADLLKEAFPNHAAITGETPIHKRQDEVDKFQEDDSITDFIGNLKAAGTGHTLTKAHHVVAVEFCWVPADMIQAEDRAHRIGQKDSVNIHYLVVEGSLEADMIHTLIEKEEIIESALDAEDCHLL